MHALTPILHSLGSNPGQGGLDPGDAGWGDVLFVSLWAIGSLLLAAYYCYKAFFAR